MIRQGGRWIEDWRMHEWVDEYYIWETLFHWKMFTATLSSTLVFQMHSESQLPCSGWGRCSACGQPPLRFAYWTLSQWWGPTLKLIHFFLYQEAKDHTIYTSCQHNFILHVSKSLGIFGSLSQMRKWFRGKGDQVWKLFPLLFSSTWAFAVALISPGMIIFLSSNGWHAVKWLWALRPSCTPNR